MEGLDLLKTELWHPLSVFGLNDPFFSVNAHTITNTWIMLGMLIVVLIPIRYLLTRNHSVTRFLVLSNMAEWADLITQSLGRFSFTHFCFITALFLFILLANCLMVIPFLEEPTGDLNTTLALGIIAFCYIQVMAIREHGLVAYIKEYFTPFFVMFPLHVVGKLASIISLSFRLFGNIFGGATISSIYFGAIKGSFLLETFGILSGINLVILLFFGIFEGFLQAFVFTMLTLTYLSIALQEEETEHTKEPS